MISGFKKVVLGTLTFASVVGGATSIIMQNSSTAIAADTVEINATTNQLPSNNIWDSGSAPADRWQSLSESFAEVERVIMEAINKDSITQQEKNDTNQLLNTTITAIKFSQPSFPNAGQVALRNGYQKPQGVIKVSHSIAEENYVKQTFNQLNNNLKTLQTDVTKSLNTTGPASKEKYSWLSGKKYDQAIQKTFNEAKDNMSSLLNTSRNVATNGLTINHKETTYADLKKEVIDDIDNDVGWALSKYNVNSFYMTNQDGTQRLLDSITFRQALQREIRGIVTEQIDKLSPQQ